MSGAQVLPLPTREAGGGVTLVWNQAFPLPLTP